MSIAFLNNQYVSLHEAKISPLDRGFLFGDSVYEVMPIYNGKVFLYEQHLARLERSLKSVHIELCFDELQLNIKALIQKNIDYFNQKQLSLYLQISRGTYERRDHAYTPKGQNVKITPTVFMYCTPLAQTIVDKLIAQDSEDQIEGISVTLENDIRWHRCDIKSTNLLPNILARQTAVAAGADEAILMRDDQLTEGSASNLFAVVNGEVVTTPKSEMILCGVTRDIIIELMIENNISFKETHIYKSSISDFSEAWVSSSTKEILPIRDIDGVLIGNGKVGPFFYKLAKLFHNLKLKSSS